MARTSRLVLRHSAVADWGRAHADIFRPARRRVESPSFSVAASRLAGGLLARRNLRLGRGDRRGAFRVAAVIVILGTAADLLRLPDAVSTWFSVASGNLARRLFDGALVWIFYVAVEPYVRRLWPTTLIAWNRVLEGRLRDPLVGRHILIGGLFGLALSALFLLRGPGAGWLGSTPDAPVSAGLTALAGPAAWTAEMIDTVRSAFNLPVTMLMVMLVARVLLRRAWLAYLSLYRCSRCSIPWLACRSRRGSRVSC